MIFIALPFDERAVRKPTRFYLFLQLSQLSDRSASLSNLSISLQSLSDQRPKAHSGGSWQIFSLKIT
jgi:hypothetical protein